MQSSVLYNNPVQTEIVQDNKRLIDWLHGDVWSSGCGFLHRQFCCWFLLAGILWDMLMCWDIDIFLLKSDLSEPVLFKNFEKKLCMPECFLLAQFHWKVKLCSVYCWLLAISTACSHFWYSGFVLFVTMFILVPYVNLVVVVWHVNCARFLFLVIFRVLFLCSFSWPASETFEYIKFKSFIFLRHTFYSLLFVYSLLARTGCWNRDAFSVDFVHLASLQLTVQSEAAFTHLSAVRVYLEISSKTSNN